MEKLDLNGQWNLCNASGAKLCNVTVPGSVVSGLLDEGLIKDPYFGTNEYEVRDLLKEDYVFEKKFVFNPNKEFCYELVTEGIDTVADIYLNGRLLKSVNNMHIGYETDCTGFLKPGENYIKIYFHSPVEYVKQHVPAPGKEITFVNMGVMEGSQYIRKAHSMFGWDWGIQLPDMGIWRDIYIRGYDKAIIRDVKISQEHLGSVVKLRAQTEITGKQDSDKEFKVYYKIIDPDGNEAVFSDEYIINNPKLWWPRGYGEQPLYVIQAVLAYKDIIVDTKTFNIGLRTLTVSRDEDEWGREFAFCVNGVKIFAKGANYIPEDAIYSRISREIIDKLIKAAVDAGFNCLRMWGGGYYPSDYFYDVCDKSGIILWQDFMFACNVYELDEAFAENIKQEVIYNAGRLKNHACLGLWCGNNELETAWQNWGGYREHSELLKKDYLEIFEKIIPDALRTVDDTTFYWPSSPSSGGGFKDTDSQDDGDVHYWDVWHGEKPFSEYEKFYFRFCSEFGFQSFPCEETVESYTGPDDRNPFSMVMESHQKNDAANGKILKYLSENFLYPKDMGSLIYVSQIMQGIAMKTGVEHWRRNRGRCMGALYWQLNDNWPVASWAGIDYYGRWKALHYMARRFYADILGTVKFDNKTATPVVQNETMKNAKLEVCLKLKDMNFNVLWSSEDKISVKPLSVESGKSVDIKKLMAGREKEVFLEAVFRQPDETQSKQVVMALPYKHMKLPKAHISYNASMQVTDGMNRLIIRLKSDAPAFFTEIKLKGITEPLSDNYFDITDEQEYIVTAELPLHIKELPVISIKSLCDTY